MLVYLLPGVFTGDANLFLGYLNMMTSSTCAYHVEKIVNHNFQNQL